MKIKNLLLLSLSLFLFQTISAQNVWTEINELKIDSSPNDRQIIPKKYKTFEIDIVELRNLLESAPERNSQAALDNNIHLLLPTPDGNFQRFRIEKASILAPELSSKFPMIKSYVGAGIDDPTATVRFDLTQNGFHAQIITSASSTIYIDPYAKGNIEQYIIYYKKDFFKKSNFQCHVETTINEVSNEKTPNTLRSAGDCQLRQYRLALACTGEYAAFHGGTTAGALAAMNTTMVRVNGIFERDMSITMELVGNTDELIYLDGTTDPFDNNSASTLINQNQTNTDNVIGSANYDIGHVFSTGGGGLAQLYSPCTGNKARGITGQGNPIGDPFDVDYVAHEMGHQYGANHTQNNSCNSVSSTSMEPGSASTIMGYAGICTPNVQSNSDDYFHAISLQEMMANVTGGNSSSCATILTSNNTAPTCTVNGSHTIPISTPFILTGGGFDADSDPMTYCWEQMDPQAATMPPVSTSTAGPAFRSLDPSPLSYRYFPSLGNVIAGTNNQWEVLPSVSRTMNFRMTVRDNHLGGGCTDEKDVVISTTSAAGPFLVQVPNTAVTWPVGGVEAVTWDVAGTDGNGVDCQNVDILLSTDGGNTYPITLASSISNNGSYNVTVPNNPTTTARVMIICSDNVFFDISDTDFIIENTGPKFTLSANLSSLDVCDTEVATYNIDLTSILGFNSSVTLSASGAPLGSTVTFSPATVTPTGTTTMMVSSLNTASAGLYTIEVTGTGGSLTATVDVTLNLNITVNQTPWITSPMNAAVDQVSNVSLEWDLVANATSYEYEIATDPSFSTIVDTQVDLTSNSAIANNLNGTTTYYWRVRGEGEGDCGAGPWSQVYSFTTETCSDVTLMLTLDQYGSETTWSIVSDGVTYASGGPYTDDTDGLVVTESICLANRCYDFIIDDTYGDGICCGYGNGSYSLVDVNQNVLASGGQFISSDTTNFCLSFPTCSDGVMNGDETGVDCGGSSCPSCTTGLYVDETATGNNDGSSWANAFTDLQDALAIGANDIINIAEGTYKPTATSTRGISFDMPEGITLLGGYPAGGGTRDSDLYETILSGDIDNVATVTGDSYHVVSVKDVGDVTIDGLTIRDGNANDDSSFGRSRGGGLYVKGSTLTLIATTVKWNRALFGGGMFATLSPNVMIMESTFKSNRANNGSALYHSNATNMYVKSTTITNNTADIRSAIEVNNSLYTYMENSVITNNVSKNSNAIAFVATNRDQTCDIYSSTITGESKDRYLLTLQVGFGDQLDVNIYNSIIAHQDGSYTKAIKEFNNGILNLLTESCYIQGSSVTGTTNNNIYTDVVGALALEADYSLSAGSPAIDEGDNAFATQLTGDINGDMRIVNVVDIGAFETQVAEARKMNDVLAEISVFPNPTNGMLHVVTNLENIDIFIFNVLGKQMMQSKAKDIDMSQLPEGIYILNIQQNGKVMKNKKVMKN